MGNRFLRDAILRSDCICECGDGAQLLFYKLISVVDDYGCFDGRERIIAINAWPLQEHAVKTELHELHERDAIVRYLNRGKPYIAIMQWGEATRNYRRRWPAPPVNNDIPDLRYRIPFNNVGNGEQFMNPRGADDVSILLDIHGRPVSPQPKEWRRVDDDWMPIGSEPMPRQNEEKKTTRRTTQRERTTRVAGDTQRVRSVDAAVPIGEEKTTPEPESVAFTGTMSMDAADTQHARNSPSYLRTISPIVAVVAEGAAASVQRERNGTSTTAATAANDELIGFDGGAWTGLTDAQIAHWQDMFADMSIPDQLDRAAAWLAVHPAERDLYAKQADGFGSFLIRWLLREARGNGTVRTR